MQAPRIIKDFSKPATPRRTALLAITLAVICLAAGPALAADERTEIGGATTAVAYVPAFGVNWALYNTASHLHATVVTASRARMYSIEVEGFIRDVLVVNYGGRRVALLATGSEGLVAIDVTDPRKMTQLVSVTVNYLMDGITWTEGGGDIVYNNTIESLSGSISALASDGVDLWIADEDFGIHRTSLDHLLALSGPTLEADGTLLVDQEVYTLQYAGENPWGGPRSLSLHNGLLFAAQGFLGMGVYDPQTLERLGGYNLYTDADMVEDWFIDMVVADEVQPGFLDPVTGMPDYQQASFEILEVWHGGVEAPTPWADFDRYGRYYYNTNAVTLADFDNRTIAYLAAGLGGVVAVELKTPGQGAGYSFDYLGYAPGVPAHGPDEPTQSGGEPSGGSLFPHYGAGMLKESGVVDVAVHGTTLYYTDHFAGLVALARADDPAQYWKGPDAPYDNDDPTLGDGILGDHWPDDEFVTSYDMDPYDPEDHESLPTWMYAVPSEFCTGEIGGHGGPFAVLPNMNPGSAGIDLLVAVGGGGMGFLDVKDITAPDHVDRWAMRKSFATTKEVGFQGPGLPYVPINIGHTQGVAVSSRYLYVADGPHGVTAWQHSRRDGALLPEMHVVANTLQDEYPEVFGGVTVYPTPHAYGVVFDDADDTLFVMCQGLGLRRVDVSKVEAGRGRPGRPLLMAPLPTDLFEHNTEQGSVDGIPKQDHTFDMAREGNLAFVADGNNGLTIYDLTKDPTNLQSGFVVANLGGSAGGKAELGRSTGIALWYLAPLAKRYALLAAGPRGVGVVDVTDPADPVLIKVFEPIKIEDGKVGHADGRAVDVAVVGSHAYFSYDSFGVVCYSISDLIAPLPAGVDPTEIWKVQAGEVLFDHRPEAVYRFRIKDVPGYEDVAGGALNMSVVQDGGVVFYVAYGVAGVATILWNDPANPLLLDLAPTPGEAATAVEKNGRLFVADGAGGLIYFD